VKFTSYFLHTRARPDRAKIRDEWIEAVIAAPDRTATQTDGRLRLWKKIPEIDNRALRLILLDDGMTVHNAFFDRRVKL